MSRFSLIAAVTACVLAFGCDDQKPAADTPPNTPSMSSTPTSTFDEHAANSQLGGGGSSPTSASEQSVADRKPKDGEEVAVLDTEQGQIVLMFFPDVAPGHVKNFKDLVKKGFYNGTKFHRTMPGFMIQGGDPNTKNGPRETWGQGGPGYAVKAEFNDIHHVPGILSMARSKDPDSAGSQFFIVVGDAGFLDHQYTAFGKVVKGMEVANKIVERPTLPPPDQELAANPVAIKKATIQKWPVR